MGKNTENAFCKGFAALMGGKSVEDVQEMGFTFRVVRGWKTAKAMLEEQETPKELLDTIAYTWEVNSKAGTVQAAFKNDTWGVIRNGEVAAVGDTKKDALAAYAVKRGTGEYHGRANIDVETGAKRRDALVTATVAKKVLTPKERELGAKYAPSKTMRHARFVIATVNVQAEEA